MMRARVTIEATGGTTTGIRATRIVEKLDAGTRPRVKVAFPNGHELRVRVGSHDGEPFIPISAATRRGAGVIAGEDVTLTIDIDDEPVVIEIPDDLAQAFDESPKAKAFFEGLTPSQQKGFTTSVTSAKKPETRRRRLAKAVAALEDGQKRP